MISATTGAVALVIASLLESLMTAKLVDDIKGKTATIVGLNEASAQRHGLLSGNLGAGH